jgi:hypothetical protein
MPYSRNIIVLAFVFLIFISNVNDIRASATVLPKLAVEDVVIIAHRFAKDQNINLTGFKITAVQYYRKSEIWIIRFRSDSLVLGEGDFAVQVSDNNPSEAKIQPSL